MDVESFPQYLRIALDIASKISVGDLKEREKITGRSLLSSRYNVSPETVRKALLLLSDMKVVEVKEKSGFTILSADNAKRFLDSFQNRHEQQELHDKLQELVHQHNSISRQMSDICSKLLHAQQQPLPAEKSLPNYEVTVAPDSDKIGRSIGSLQFWQATGATIIAIRRNQNTIISPGPYAELYDGDVVVFVGAPESVAAVSHYLNPACLPSEK